MATKYIGNSYYEDSILVRCDCGQHFMEVFIFLNYEGQYMVGIEWHSYHNYKKYKFPDFYFKDLKDFKSFIDAVKHFTEDPETAQFPIRLDTSINDKPNGSLEINRDVCGYIDFDRCIYNKKGTKKKLIWNLCLKNQDVLNEFIESLDSLYAEYWDKLYK